MQRERHHTEQRDRGFTLVELLIVIVILGVLATVVVFAVQGVIGSGDDAAVDTDERTLATAQEAYYADTGSYGTETDLVSAGYIREESTLHDITLHGDGTYTIVSLTPSSSGSGSGGSGSGSGGSGSGTTLPAVTTVAGQVVDATDDSPISSAQVCVLGTATCDTTDGGGNYILTGLTAGSVTIEVTATGFSDLEETVTVVDATTTTQNAALSPDLGAGELRIVLEWNASPNDLDSHLWLPASDPYHVFYSNQGDLTSGPFAALDVDASGGFGPETITIPQRFNGTYTYAVHNYSGSPDFASSGAVVRVYNSSGLFREFSVPSGGTGTWWHVFSLNGATGSISTVNSVSASSPAPY